MNEPLRHPLTMNGRDPSLLRGDRIDGERYWTPEFAKKEWDRLWTRIWHVAGRTSELQEPGDYLVHDFMHESVIVVKQDDGSLRAFYNSCAHRGQRLVWNSAHADRFHCPYHGWVFGRDGVVQSVPDPETYPQGDPCGRVSLRELRVDTWGGFVWYTMDPDAEPLLEYLEPLPELYAAYPLETLVRVGWMRIDLDTNWKFATDNFSESYHTRTAHPQVPPWIDQDWWSARHEMFPRGHGRTVQPMRPSLRDRLPPGTKHFFDDILRQWSIDPAAYPDFETKARQGWLDLKRAKHRLWKEHGYLHYEKMDDEQITDSLHTVVFPNLTISLLPDHVIFFRSEPHPDDPNKCSFDLWSFVFPVAGMTEGEVIMFGHRKFEEAHACDHRSFDRGRGVPELAGQIVYQDMMLAEGQHRGMRSRGYQDSHLAAQETRVRFFHEVLNDWLEGRR